MSGEPHAYDFEQSCRLIVGNQKFTVPRFTIQFSPEFDRASIGLPLPERLVLEHAPETVLLVLPGKDAEGKDRVMISLVPYPCPAPSPQGHAHLQLRAESPDEKSVLRRYFESDGEF